MKEFKSKPRKAEDEKWNKENDPTQGNQLHIKNLNNKLSPPSPIPKKYDQTDMKYDVHSENYFMTVIPNFLINFILKY